MKLTINMILIFLLFLFWSCKEEIEPVDDKFVKIYGKESDSQGFGLIENPDGSIFVLGQTSTAGFDFEYGTSGTQFTNSNINRAPSISLINESGNLIERYLIPIPSAGDLTNLEFFLEEFDPNRAALTDMVPLSNGGYLAIGQWFDLPFSQELLGFTKGNFPFLMWLNENFEIVDFWAPNGGASWDGKFRAEPKIYTHPSGEIYVLFRFLISLTSNERGFSIIKFNAAGELIWGLDDQYEYSTFDNPNNIVTAWDIEFNDDGQLVLAGQLNRAIIMLIIDPITGAYSQKYLDDTNDAGLTDPGDLVKTAANTFAAFYGSFPNVIFNKYRLLPSGVVTADTIDVLITNFIPEKGFGEGQFIREAVPTQDGGFLVLTEILRAGTFSSLGELIRLDEKGAVLWTYFIEGSPQNILETSDGGVVLLYNPQFNELTPKTTLIKLSPNGKL